VALLASRLCILGDDPCGGSEVVLWEDARILESAGIPVRVYGRAARSGAPVQIIPFRTRTAQLNTIEYMRGLLQNEPEALILAYNEPALAGSAPDRTIVRFDWTTPLPRYWNWPLWLARFQRAQYLFPSESERQNFLPQHARIPSSQLMVIPNAVDLEVFKSVKRAPNAASNGSLRVGFAGQWSKGKGLPELLQAWTELKPSLPIADLCLAGGPGLWKRDREALGTGESEARVQEMEREHLLCSYGSISRSKMPEFWNSVDIAVVPSLSEAFGLVALEALACGVPVIASAVGGLKEIVLDGECGLLVPPGDTLALARALRLLLTDESLRRRLSAAARSRAQEFSLLRRSRELLGLLLERQGGIGTSPAQRGHAGTSAARFPLR
jgi:glycosyltransferase involved in cell wall biosynthesis